MQRVYIKGGKVIYVQWLMGHGIASSIPIGIQLCLCLAFLPLWLLSLLHARFPLGDTEKPIQADGTDHVEGNISEQDADVSPAFIKDDVNPLQEGVRIGNSAEFAHVGGIRGKNSASSKFSVRTQVFHARSSCSRGKTENLVGSAHNICSSDSSR